MMMLMISVSVLRHSPSPKEWLASSKNAQANFIALPAAVVKMKPQPSVIPPVKAKKWAAQALLWAHSSTGVPMVNGTAKPKGY